jgi:hypothetical protein
VPAHRVRGTGLDLPGDGVERLGDLRRALGAVVVLLGLTAVARDLARDHQQVGVAGGQPRLSLRGGLGVGANGPVVPAADPVPARPDLDAHLRRSSLSPFR